MKLTKTLVAAALLTVGTGAAQASIQSTSTTGDNEAFLVVYDKTQKLTYDLDLGSLATFTKLSNAVANKLDLHYDLSQDANWTTFTSALDAANTKFGVVVAKGQLNAMFTNIGTPAPAASGFKNIPGNIGLEAGRINIGLTANTALNVSKLVTEADSAKGGWAQSAGSANTLNNIWGSYTSANAAIAYGVAGDFFKEAATATAVTSTKLGTWTLAGNSLDFHYDAPTPAAVPLPAAVWMFGAGLMGVLRLNRRKSAAV